jgi:hypothetical protein
MGSIFRRRSGLQKDLSCRNAQIWFCKGTWASDVDSGFCIWEGGDQGFKRICHVGMHIVKERGLRMRIPDFDYHDCQTAFFAQYCHGQA